LHHLPTGAYLCVVIQQAGEWLGIAAVHRPLEPACGVAGRLKTSWTRADNVMVEQMSTTARNDMGQEYDMRQELANTPFRTPHVWLKPGVLAASLGINLLALAMPMLIFQVYNRIIPMQATDTFVILIAGMLVVVVLDALLKILRTVALSWDGARFDHRESLKAMNHMLEADTLEFEKHPAGYYLDKLHALEQVQEFYSSQSVLVAIDMPFIVLFLLLIALIAGPLVYIPLGLLSLFMVVSLFSGRRLRQALENRCRMEDHRQNFLIESLQGIHTIKSMAMEALMLRRYERLQRQSAESVCELSRISSVVQGLGATFAQLSVVSFVGFGSYYVVFGDLSIGALAAGTMLSSRVLQPGLSAMGLWTQIQSIRLAKDKVQEFFDIACENDGNYRPEQSLRGRIELAAVSFNYPGEARKLLDQVSLVIEPGESIAISGSNGTGKSTLICLLAAFINPVSGQIRLDDHSVADYDVESLRSHIGIVPQRGILFEGTILENMTLYRQGEAKVQAMELAQLLGLDEIISRLPNGLDTQVGGSVVDTLSEGVRQRIVMVRSLVGHPSVILFDDANANFDIRNDNRLLRLIERLKGNRTLVMVTHRPSFQRLCDRHYVLADGKLHLQDTQVRRFTEQPRALPAGARSPAPRSVPAPAQALEIR